MFQWKLMNLSASRSNYTECWEFNNYGILNILVRSACALLTFRSRLISCLTTAKLNISCREEFWFLLFFSWIFFPFLRKHNVLALVVINVPLMLPAASKLNLLQVLRFVLCTFRFRLFLLTWTRTEVVHLLCFVGGNAAGAWISVQCGRILCKRRVSRPRVI